MRFRIFTFGAILTLSTLIGKADDIEELANNQPSGPSISELTSDLPETAKTEGRLVAASDIPSSKSGSDEQGAAEKPVTMKAISKAELATNESASPPKVISAAANKVALVRPPSEPCTFRKCCKCPCKARCKPYCHRRIHRSG